MSVRVWIQRTCILLIASCTAGVRSSAGWEKCAMNARWRPDRTTFSNILQGICSIGNEYFHCIVRVQPCHPVNINTEASKLGVPVLSAGIFTHSTRMPFSQRPTFHLLTEIQTHTILSGMILVLKMTLKFFIFNAPVLYRVVLYSKIIRVAKRDRLTGFLGLIRFS